MKPFRGKRTEPKSRPGDSTRGARPGAGPRTRTGRGAPPAGRAPGRTFPGRAPGPAGRRPQGRGAASPRGRPPESRPAARPWAAAPALRGPVARRGAAHRRRRDCPHAVPRQTARGHRPARRSRAGRRASPASESAPRPTRLETRTKESCKRASRRPRTNPAGAMKVKALLAPGRDPAARPRAHRRPVPPAAGPRARRPGGRSPSAFARTRKMVNYARAGRSQRKLWWRPAAVLTCKSIVKLGYRGERLIEPSNSWFPPKFPSG